MNIHRLDSRPAIFLLGLLAIIPVWYLDMVTTAWMRWSVFYIVPIAFVAWMAGLGPALVLGAIATIGRLILELATVPSAKWFVPLWNMAMYAGLLGIVATLATTLKKQRQLLAVEREAKRSIAEAARTKGELEATRAAYRELETFSYAISHHFRSPLRSINGYSRVLMDRAGSKLNPEETDYLRRLHEASGRLGILVDDLLSLFRVSGSEPSRTVVDFTALAQSVALDLAERVPGSKVDFRIAQGMTVRGDHNLLRVVLENLIGNAMKFASRSARPLVEVGRRRLGDEEVFFVRDNGVGFDMAHAGRLFKPFQRLHKAGEFEGTGIGLAMVERIISRHGGRIWAESQPDKGATFNFVLGGLPSAVSVGV